MRGIMAVTSLQRNGFNNTIYNVVGGYDKMKEKGVQTHT